MSFIRFLWALIVVLASRSCKFIASILAPVVASAFCSVIAPAFILMSVVNSGPARLLALDFCTSACRLCAYCKLLSLHVPEPGVSAAW